MVDKQAVLQLMDESEAVYLATVAEGRPRIRALNNLRRQHRDMGFTVYMATSISSGKVREIRANPAVSAYYSEPKKVHGVTLSGEMEVLTDPDLKAALWQEEWKIYWPGGAADPDYAVLRLKPTQAAGWWGTTPFDFEVREA
jgi:general stress protein 26